MMIPRRFPGNAHPRRTLQFALAIEGRERRAHLDGVIVGHKIALPGFFFAGVAGLHTALAQREEDGVLEAMADVRREVRRIHAPERVVDRVVFARRHDPLLKRRTKLRDCKQQIGVLQKFDIAGGLGDGGNRERLRQALERQRLTGVREKIQNEVHHVSRLPQMMTLGDVTFHDVTQELLEDSRITLAQVTREPP